MTHEPTPEEIRAYERGAEAARINERLVNLDGSVLEIRVAFKEGMVAIQKRFDDQDSEAKSAKSEGRRLALQVFGTVMVALIGAASLIIVALLKSGPT